MPSIDSPLPSSEPGIPARLYRNGTLLYTARGLAVLFAWLLGGDFAFTFFESVFGKFIPLYLKDLHASNTLIGVMAGSISGGVNLLFLPNISLWSDNHRGPLGRRIPFLLVVAPLTVLFLVAVGFAPEIAETLHTHFLARLSPSLSLASVALILLCAFVVFYHFFNMVLGNAYNWLLRDVVPIELMARFLSWFRFVGTMASIAFLWLVFPTMLSHRKEVFLGVGLFYLVTFLLMCLHVKEGGYPPAAAAERPGLLRSFARYFRDCLSVPLYRNFFLANVLTTIVATCSNPFAILFCRETLHLGLDDMGKIFAWVSALCAVAYFPLGWLCDRFSPLLVGLASLLGMAVLAVCIHFLAVDKTSYLVWSLAVAVPTVAWQLSSMAAAMKLFPEEKFGQFSSALNVFGSGSLLIGNIVVGRLMDALHSDYRAIFLWNASLFVLALLPMILAYRHWKRHGGPDHYVAPLPA